MAEGELESGGPWGRAPRRSPEDRSHRDRFALGHDDRAEAFSEFESIANRNYPALGLWSCAACSESERLRGGAPRESRHGWKRSESAGDGYSRGRGSCGAAEDGSAECFVHQCGLDGLHDAQGSSASPRSSSIIAADQIWAIGLAMPLPAMSGAQP